MGRRQYEARWLGLPMKQVSLVTVGRLFTLIIYNMLNPWQLTIQSSAFILVGF